MSRRRRKTKSRGLGQVSMAPDSSSVKAAKSMADAKAAIQKGHCLSAARHMTRAAYLFGKSSKRKESEENVKNELNKLSEKVGFCFLGNPNALGD